MRWRTVPSGLKYSSSSLCCLTLFGILVNVACADSGAVSSEAIAPDIHMVSFGTADYIERFHDSLFSKAIYAKLHGYKFSLFTSSDDDDLGFLKKQLKKKVMKLDCGIFREQRWRGDLRYCKLAALKGIFASASAQKKTEWVFWHDLDTHIMQPATPLTTFLTAGENKPLVFTENGLSLNNGAFFLSLSGWGAKFFQQWWDLCKTGEWAWADNGSMLEALLIAIGGDSYKQECGVHSHIDYDPQKPFAAEGRGGDLSKCFTKHMTALGHPCCGSGDRKVDNIAFLAGSNSFNHHTCVGLLKSKDYADIDRAFVKQFCFKDDSTFEYMVHDKGVEWGSRSLKLVKKLWAAKKNIEL